MIQLDQNAGLPFDEQALQTYILYSQFNNIYGYGNQKRQVQQEVEEKRQELCKFFGFDKVIYNSGATESIYSIFNRIRNIKVFDGQHPTVEKLQADIQMDDGICICCLVSSSTSEIQQLSKEDVDKYPYIILDISQAIGKAKLGQSQAGLPRQGEKNIHCMFFSSHKLGGPKHSGFLVCSNEFYNKYLLRLDQIKPKTENNEKEYIQLHPDLQQGGSFDIPGFMSSAQLILELQIPPKKQMYNTFFSLKKILEDCPKVKNILPEINEKDINNINDYQNIFSSITFELEGLCPRSFQHILENNGVQIGFKTACQSGQTGVLRMSWRNPQINIDVVKKQFNQSIKYLEEKNEQLKGGKRLTQSFLNEINNNKFWLLHHFAPSHDLPPEIDKKYEKMFQPDLLKQFTTISLKIPPHNDSHRLELDIQKKKENSEDFDFEKEGIRIQKRRLSKYLWINNPEAEYELSLEDFETEKMKIFLSDQVFRSVSDNLIFKKQLPTNFEKDVNEYEIEIKNYPETLLQEIIVKHPNPEKAPPKQTRKDKPKQLKPEFVESSKSESESESSENKNNDGNDGNDGNGSEMKGGVNGGNIHTEHYGGRKDPDYIREEIRFLISSYNLKLLTFLGGNNLSVGILTNLDKLYKRGQKPSKYNVHHQCIVQNLDYITYQNCFGTVLTSMRLMKEIDSRYPLFSQKSDKETQFNIPQSKFYSEQDLQFSTKELEKQIIIQQLNNTDITKLKEFIDKNNGNDEKQIIVYLPSINTDEIEEDYGIYHYFKKSGFDYDIDFMQYYDVWTHQYRSDKQIVMFYKGLKLDKKVDKQTDAAELNVEKTAELNVEKTTELNVEKTTELNNNNDSESM